MNCYCSPAFRIAAALDSHLVQAYLHDTFLESDGEAPEGACV
jgi:hypothetical protein